jgi:GDP-4-dehydro-6-deoxy-D-mannose reductase
LRARGVKVLITGANGFHGSHLAELCRARGASVVGVSRQTGTDIVDGHAVESCLAANLPDVVFHLAGKTGGTDKAELYGTNVVGTRNIIEAAAGLAKRPLVVVATSGAIYGPGPTPGAPIRECVPPAPVTAYAASKAAQDAEAERLGQELGVPVIRVRPFNQVGAGLPATFVASSIARQIAESEAGRRAPKLQVGRIDTVRDFSDIRDVARGYWLLAEHGRPHQAYNLCSGRGVAISSLLHQLLAMSETPIRVEGETEPARSGDIPVHIGDATKVRLETGWQPEISLEKALTDFLNHWRRSIRGV